MGRKKSPDTRTQKAVVADRIAGMKVKDIAAKHGLHRVSVSRIISRFKQEVPDAEFSQSASQYRERLKNKSVVAIEAGLDDPENSYKRASIGVQVMKGIGEFVPDQGPVGIQMLMDRCPSEWRQRYGLVSNEGERAIGELAGAEEDEKDSGGAGRVLTVGDE